MEVFGKGIEVFQLEGDSCEAPRLCRDKMPVAMTVHKCKAAADSAMGIARDTLKNDSVFTKLGCISLCCRLYSAMLVCGAYLERDDCDLYTIEADDILAWQQLRKALNQLKNSECVADDEAKRVFQLPVAVQDVREKLVSDADCLKSFTDKRWTAQMLTCVTDLRAALPPCVVSEQRLWSTIRNQLLSNAEAQKELLTNPRFASITPMLESIGRALDTIAAMESDKEGSAAEAYIHVTYICTDCTYICMYVHTVCTNVCNIHACIYTGFRSELGSEDQEACGRHSGPFVGARDAPLEGADGEGVEVAHGRHRDD